MSRPRTIAGLILRLAALNRSSAGLVIVILVVVLALFALVARACTADVRVATFNIENFPRDEHQVRGAFAAIRELDAPVVAVQEITDPALFERAAREELGDAWRFVHDGSDHVQHVGVLYDSARFELAYARTHDEIRLGARGKPALEVRLRGGARALRLFVVHLKAGGGFAHVRREQLRQLAAIVEDAVESWDEVVVLGDFNATGDEDRRNLARFADVTGLTWSSEPLACTSYWNRTDGCRGVALDHLFTREAPDDVRARGPCEEIGCAPSDRCPTFHREVSDHCPVTADL